MSAAVLSRRTLAAIAAVGLAFGVPGLAAAQTPITIKTEGEFGDNMLPDSSFEKQYEPWWGTPDLTLDNSSGALCTVVPPKGGSAWSDIVGIDDVVLKKDEHYYFTFKAKGTLETPIRALVQEGHEPWGASYEGNPIMGQEFQEYNYAWTAKADIPIGQVVFQVGGATTEWTFCIDDVSLRTGPEPEPYRPDTGPTVRVNQLGYLPGAVKRANIVNPKTDPLDWTLRDANGNSIATGKTRVFGQDMTLAAHVHIADFSDVNTEGTGYTLEVDGDVSYPFAIAADLYSQLRYDALAYFYLARSGIEIEAQYVGEEYARPAGHIGVAPNKGDTNVPCAAPQEYYGGWTCDYTLDVTGGWYDAGDHGKYMVNGGISVAQVMSTYEHAKLRGTAEALADNSMRIPEAGNGVPDVLDEARWELEWMRKMRVPEGDQYAGLYHHKIHDERWTGLPLDPAKDEMPRELRRPSTAATLNFAAVAAQGARLWREFDAEFADALVAEAKAAYAAAQRIPDVYASESDGVNGGGPYNDGTLTDEFYWAAVQLYLTTGEQEYADLITYSEELQKDTFYRADGFDWQHTAMLGHIDLALVDNSHPQRERVREGLLEAAKRYLGDQRRVAFGQPYKPGSLSYIWGSNSAIVNNAIVLAVAYDLTKDETYRQAAIEAADYLLGRNGMNNSYITGYGTVYSENQHSRMFAAQLSPNSPHPPKGTLAGGPNSDVPDPVSSALFSLGCAPQQCYVDHIQAWGVNEMTINWNSALSWYATWLADQGSSVGGADNTPLLIGGGAAGAVAIAAAAVVALRRRGTSAAPAASTDA